TEDVVDYAEDSAFKLPWLDHFAARWRADLLAPVDGDYQLIVGADDGQRLLVDGKVVLEDDSLHGYTEVSGTIQLTAGPHALELQFFQNEGAARCRLFWVVPGSGRTIVPTSAVVPPWAGSDERRVPALRRFVAGRRVSRAGPPLAPCSSREMRGTAGKSPLGPPGAAKSRF